MRFWFTITVILAAIVDRSPCIAASGNPYCKGILPPGCSCSERVIDCSNAGINTTEIFLNIPHQFPELISLNMTGNRFDYLEMDLFNLGRYAFQTLEKLDLSDCQIVGIHVKAFVGLPRLEELILAHNALSFRNRSSTTVGKTEKPGTHVWPTENFLHPIASTLKVLDLSDAFDRRERQAYPLELVGNLSTMFNSTEFKVLQYLNLSSNHIGYLPSDTFCRAPVLEYVYLTSNRLTSFIPDDLCAHSLMELHLQSNFIRRVDAPMMDALDSRSFLTKIFMADNPFTCDCDAQKFIRWMRASSRLIDKSEYTCARAKPKEFAGERLLRVAEDRLRCSTDASEYLHGVYIMCALAFVGLVALLFCIMYTNRGLLCRRSVRSWMPLGGYQSLGREAEVKAEMV